MTGIRAVCLAAGIIFLVLFSIPIVMYRVLNLGNATGLAAGLMLVSYALLAPDIHRLIRTSLLFRSLMIIFCVLAAAGMILAVLISICILRTACSAPEANQPLIVLGCQVKGTRPSLMLTERLEAARDYLTENPGVQCILSGGQGEDEEISEAACMAQYLTGHGIASDRLILEDQSTSTRENLRFSLELLEGNGLGTSPVIVTNEFHEYRAFLIAKKLGLMPSAAAAKTHWWMLPTYFVREWYGVIYEWLGLRRG